MNEKQCKTCLRVQEIIGKGSKCLHPGCKALMEADMAKIKSPIKKENLNPDNPMGLMMLPFVPP